MSFLFFYLLQIWVKKIISAIVLNKKVAICLFFRYIIFLTFFLICHFFIGGYKVNVNYILFYDESGLLVF